MVRAGTMPTITTTTTSTSEATTQDGQFRRRLLYDDLLPGNYLHQGTQTWIWPGI